MEFKEELKKYTELVNEQLQKYVIKEKCPEETLNNSMAYSLISSAKR